MKIKELKKFRYFKFNRFLSKLGSKIFNSNYLWHKHYILNVKKYQKLIFDLAKDGNSDLYISRTDWEKHIYDANVDYLDVVLSCEIIYKDYVSRINIYNIKDKKIYYNDCLGVGYRGFENRKYPHDNLKYLEEIILKICNECLTEYED